MREDLIYEKYQEYERYILYKVYTKEREYLYNECFNKKVEHTKLVGCIKY